MIDVLYKTFILATAVGTISYTISRAEIFKPFRQLIPWDVVKALFSCPYCLSFWVAAPLVLVYNPVLISCGIYTIDIFVSWMVVVAFATVIASFICRNVFNMIEFEQ